MGLPPPAGGTLLREAPPSLPAGFARRTRGRGAGTYPAPRLISLRGVRMHGKRLHDFDLRLCRHVLDNVGGYLDRPAFSAFAERRLDPSVWKHLRALDEDD